jgi:Spy/CpxP family protein refolding chaperone
MGVHFVTSDDQAGSIDPTNDNVRIKTKVDDFRTDRARLKLEGEGVRGRKHTLQPSHGLTHQQRMQVKLEEGSTKSYNNKSEPSVRSSSSSTMESSTADKARMRSHRYSLQPSHGLTYQQRMKLKMDEQSSARSSSSVSSSTMESSTADKARMKSEGGGMRGHRHSSLPSHELTIEQRLKIKMDEGGTKSYNNKS